MNLKNMTISDCPIEKLPERHDIMKANEIIVKMEQEEYIEEVIIEPRMEVHSSFHDAQHDAKKLQKKENVLLLIVA